MKAVSSSVTGSGVSTDRISVASKQRMPKAEQLPSDQTASVFQSSPFKREVPLPHNAEFVEIDGKKYFLDAPRGTYVNIVI